MRVIIYKTPTCPKCKVLCTKMEAKGIEYETCIDVDEMQKKGITSVPVVEVDGERMDFIRANKWVNEVDI